MYLLKWFQNRTVKIAEGYLKGDKNWNILYYNPEKNLIIRKKDVQFGSPRGKKLSINRSFLSMTKIAKKRSYKGLITKYLAKFHNDANPHVN